MKILYLGSSSVCLELDHETAYYAEKPYIVFLNGVQQFRRNTNVFSLFGLRPDTDYSVNVIYQTSECATGAGGSGKNAYSGSPDNSGSNRSNVNFESSATIEKPADSGNSGSSENTRSCDYTGIPENAEYAVVFHTLAETCCVSILDFGAVGDGVSDDTSAIQAAINFIPPNGRILFPAGVYLTRPLCLRSDCTLELTADAVLRGSADRLAYPILPGIAQNPTADPASSGETPLCGFEGIEQRCYQSLLHGSYACNIAIIGPGTVDGNAQNGDWWTAFPSFPASRPRLCFLNRCENVVLHGVRWKGSPSWNLHPYFSKNISILDCSVTAPKVSPNTDAVDPDSCDGVNIIGCRFSVGDDCIAIKSGKLEMARKYHCCADHHVIRNCLMENGHGAVTMGSEASAGIRNVSVTKCLFVSTDRGLRIKTRRGRGKDNEISNVLFDKIRMERVLTPVVINMWYNCCDPDRHSEYVWSREKLPVDDRTPHLGCFIFRNMQCTGAQIAACYIDGLTENPIESVTFENVRIVFDRNALPGIPAMRNYAEPMCRAGLYLDNVRTVVCEHVVLEGQSGPERVIGHVNTIWEDGKIVYEKS